MPDSAEPAGRDGILFDRAGCGPEPRWRTIPDLVADAAERFGGREFLRFGGTSLTFTETHARSSRLAELLVCHGVRPGDRAIMMENVPDWPVSWFAILQAGAIAVPVNSKYQEA